MGQQYKINVTVDKKGPYLLVVDTDNAKVRNESGRLTYYTAPNQQTKFSVEGNENLENCSIRLPSPNYFDWMGRDNDAKFSRQIPYVFTEPSWLNNYINCSDYFGNKGNVV